MGKRRIPVKLLVHDQASMDIQCPGLSNFTRDLESQGMRLADSDITSDNPPRIEILIGVDYFSCFITCQRRVKGMNLFLSRGGLSPYGLMSKWLVSQKTFCIKHHCVCITCDNNPDVTELWALDCICKMKEEFSPAE